MEIILNTKSAKDLELLRNNMLPSVTIIDTAYFLELTHGMECGSIAAKENGLLKVVLQKQTAVPMVDVVAEQEEVVRHAPAKEAVIKITADQLEDLYRELDDYPMMTKSLLRGLKLNELADIPKSEFLDLIKNIRDKKALLKFSPKSDW